MGTILFGRYDPQLIALQMKIDADPILNNAWRLATDAHILISKKRYATALALAVFSFEEIGKFLITQWSTDPTFQYDKSKKHIMKQAAVAALFTTVEIRKKYKELNVDFNSLSEAETLKLIEAIKHGTSVGTPFTKMVVSKVYENVKWSGLYYDADTAAKGIEPARVTEENAREIMTLTAAAFKALAEHKNIYLGRFSFPMMLESISRDLAKANKTAPQNGFN